MIASCVPSTDAVENTGGVLSVLFSTVWSAKDSTSTSLKTDCRGSFVGLVYLTLTVSVSVTAESSVRVTVAAARATPPAATSRRAVPTVTKKSPGAGTESVFRLASKVTMSVAPSTAALENTGAVALVTVRSAKVATSAPLLPRRGSLAGFA